MAEIQREGGPRKGAAAGDLQLTVVICTHDRAELLERMLDSLDAAPAPPGWEIGQLVIANACRDDTAERLRRRAARGPRPLRWAEEPVPGKSRALNRAIAMLDGDLVLLVDDDHRVPANLFERLAGCVADWPEADIWCGRVKPDWDGREPPWVHERGRYRVYPLPVPNFDLGDEPLAIGPDTAAPGGGNLLLRRAVFDRVGGFAVELGPRGHNLAGSEDTDFVLRVLGAGMCIRYCPRMLQFHYVDGARLRLPYLVRKAFERSRTVNRVRRGEAEPTGGGVPRYLYRKLAGYLGAALLAPFTLNGARTRFYLMRCASTLGEMQGLREAARARRGPEAPG